MVPQVVEVEVGEACRDVVLVRGSVTIPCAMSTCSRRKVRISVKLGAARSDSEWEEASRMAFRSSVESRTRVFHVVQSSDESSGFANVCIEAPDTSVVVRSRTS